MAVKEMIDFPISDATVDAFVDSWDVANGAGINALMAVVAKKSGSEVRSRFIL